MQAIRPGTPLLTNAGGAGDQASVPIRLFELDGDVGANNICIENIGSVIKDDA